MRPSSPVSRKAFLPRQRAGFRQARQFFSRHLSVPLVALVTLGSGIINLSSAGSPALRERFQIVREVFPLEFLHISRSVSLLAGFGLVIASLNILKRKRRAYQLVAVLAGLSMVFHLTKGLDYEEALFSALLLSLLLLNRHQFTVRSSVPDLRAGLERLGLALGVALAYGVAGFWFLDRSQFGINFRAVDALQRTLLYLTLQGDPRLKPLRPFADWFLDSLYLISGIAISYAVFAIFRPVVYQYRTLPRERTHARAIVEKHGRSALDFFKLWPDKSYFFSHTFQSFLAYRVGGRFAMVLADPVGPAEEIEGIVRDFSRLCRENDWHLAFHQVLPDFLPIYQNLGYGRIKVGDEAVVDLVHFSLEGREMKKVRHYVNQLEKSGIRAVLFPPPLTEDILRQAQAVSDEWLNTPGRRERSFTLGMFDADYLRSTPLYAAISQREEMLAFMNIIPSYRKGETTIDLMRYRPGAPNGIMDYLFVRIFLHAREQGYARFSLGMAPLAGFQEKEEATMEERAIHFFLQKLNFLFSFSGLRQYKAKFATIWEPRYTVYRNALDLPRLALALGKVAEVEN